MLEIFFQHIKPQHNFDFAQNLVINLDFNRGIDIVHAKTFPVRLNGH